MKLAFKIIIILLIVYLLGGIAFWIYGSIANVDVIYQAEKNQYDREKYCYDCFVGNNKDICPKINAYSTKKYPIAQEDRSGKPFLIGDKSSVIPFNSIYECIWNESWSNGFSMTLPEKSVSHSLKKNWDHAWSGYFLLTVIILSFGTLKM